MNRSTFERDGFLVVEDFVELSRCRDLMARAAELVDAFDPHEHVSIFSTHEQTRTSDRYFLDSGDDIRFFFEEDAFDAAGNLRQAKALSLNKIGHAMHDLDPVFDQFSRQPQIGALADDLGLANAVVLQSMYIFKQPHIGGEVTPHQDSTFLYTEPMSCVGFWFALEDATVDNGCLWVRPGGHREALRSRFVRVSDGTGDHGLTSFEALDDRPLPTDGYVPLEAPAGTLVVLHGRLPHRSGANHSNHSRHAYSIHCIDRTARYPAENWLQRRASMPLRPLHAPGDGRRH